MISLSKLSYLTSKIPFEAGLIHDGLIVLFCCDTQSELAKSQLEHLSNQSTALKDSDISIFFLTDEDQEGGNKNTLYDPNLSIASQIPSLCKRNEHCESMIILEKRGDEFQLLNTRENPEPEHNWVDILLQFESNYRNNQPENGLHYRYGQIVPKTGEYMCIDCGYISEYKAGSVFPVCEVCLSGDPNGPVSTDKGFWEFIG
jgi:hypothetical protein